MVIPHKESVFPPLSSGRRWIDQRFTVSRKLEKVMLVSIYNGFTLPPGQAYTQTYLQTQY